MSSRPTDAGSFAETVYAQMTPVAGQDQTYGWALLIFLGALGQMFELMDELAYWNPSWGNLLDIDNIPDVGLPWLAQFVGVALPSGSTPAQQRIYIRQHVGWQRGTPQAMIKAIQPFLTGTQTVILLERDTDPYHFQVTTYAGETPTGLTYATSAAQYANYTALVGAYGSYLTWSQSGDATVLVNAAILSQKPGGLQYTLVIQPGTPTTYGSYANWLNDIPTYDDTMDERATYGTLLSNP